MLLSKGVETRGECGQLWVGFVSTFGVLNSLWVNFQSKLPTFPWKVQTKENLESALLPLSAMALCANVWVRQIKMNLCDHSGTFNNLPRSKWGKSTRINWLSALFSPHFRRISFPAGEEGSFFWHSECQKEEQNLFCSAKMEIFPLFPLRKSSLRYG